MKENEINLYNEYTVRKTTDFPNNYLENLNKIELSAYFQGFWNKKPCENTKTFHYRKYFVHNQGIIREELQLIAPCEY